MVARNELSSLQRTSPILAAHIRLRDSSNKDELQRVCNSAETGPGRSEMTMKLAIVPGNLYNPERQVSNFKRVRGRYDEAYDKVIANVEALNKAVGGEYAKKGDELFNVRGKLGRFGRRKKHYKRGCGLEEEATAEWNGDEKAHAKDLDDSSDCESWYEKMERKSAV